MQAPPQLQRPGWPSPALNPARQRLVAAGVAVSILLFLGGFALAGYLWSLALQFPHAPFAQPSRLYGAATRLAAGEVLSAQEMTAELAEAGYRQAEGSLGPLPPGSYRRTGERVTVHLRRFPTPEGPGGGVPVEVTFRGGGVADVAVAGRPGGTATLEPPLLASFYDDEVEERRPVELAGLPEHVVEAVLAAEDDGFFSHPGVSPTGIARALWVNLRGGELQQGGSTITQQVVKNVYLSNRRTLSRKAKEALIALALEARFGKRAILEAYLNEIYLGASGPSNLIGLGAAAQAYFGKDAAELSLAEAATLAGMIQAPADYSPLTRPDQARQRRNWVLQRLAELRWIAPKLAQLAQQEPVRVNPRRVSARRMAPYFAEVARQEARDRFDVDELESGGYLLFSTLRWRDQRAAEAAVAQGLARLEGGWERRRVRKSLQAALISIHPQDGSILAWVGGRDFAKSQFDRVAQARRQVGSAFKPMVFAAAFAEGVATPATLFRDSPINVRFGTVSWRPRNYDEAFRGWVTARTALEQSLNIPTVRIALQVGLPRLIALARDLGFTGRLAPVPALALGAFEATPLEMAEAYGSLAADGLRPPIHGLAAVLDQGGRPLLGDDLGSPRRVLPPQAAYQVTSILQGAVDHGTAIAARAVDGHLAGKTGTTNDRRDSWFAGYSPDRVTVVWVGYDDNSPTRLSGARAALPIWSLFTAGVRPANGYADFSPPAGMVRVTVDPLTGQLAGELCPHRVTEVFSEWQAPTEPCRRHSLGYPGEQWADVTLGEPLLDPVTGEPLDPAAAQEPRYIITDDGLQILDPGGDGTIVIGEATALPPQPVELSPAEAGSSILIRRSREKPPPKPPEPAGEPEPLDVAPAAAAGSTTEVGGGTGSEKPAEAVAEIPPP